MQIFITLHTYCASKIRCIAFHQPKCWLCGKLNFSHKGQQVSGHHSNTDETFPVIGCYSTWANQSQHLVHFDE